MTQGESAMQLRTKTAVGGKSKGKDSRPAQNVQYELTLNVDAVVEQALQVQTMLPGG